VTVINEFPKIFTSFIIGSLIEVFVYISSYNDLVCICIQIHLFSEIHGEINYVGKGVDKYDPLLPVSMPRDYGGVAIIWRKDIDH
jgi:hypothetical protein